MEGQFWYGIACLNGTDTPKDFTATTNWLQKAAKQGQMNAQCQLGTCRNNAKDYAGAFRWYSKAAEAGSAMGQHELGLLYIRGLGVPQDYEDAARWIRKAAEQGLMSAQNDMGRLYVGGRGVPQSLEESWKWFGRAAAQGDPIQQYRVGYASMEASNHVEAAKWFLRSAQQGVDRAQNAIGYCYEIGSGALPDRIEACKWYLLAIAQQEKNAEVNMKRLAPKLTPEELEEAKKRAAQFVPRRERADQANDPSKI
jgi:TPR repeat protein